MDFAWLSIGLTHNTEVKNKMSNQTENKITALYCRLSQEDELKGDSNSIQNQRGMPVSPSSFRLLVTHKIPQKGAQVQRRAEELSIK